MCGENLCERKEYYSGGGSPPRVRGKQTEYSSDLKVKRITPACAGKTFICFRSKASFQDHPRVCGENLSSLSKSLNA